MPLAGHTECLCGNGTRVWLDFNHVPDDGPTKKQQQHQQKKQQRQQEQQQKQHQQHNIEQKDETRSKNPANKQKTTERRPNSG